MKKLLLTLLLLPLFSFSQTQIGEDIDGEAAGDYSHVVSISADGNIVAIGAAGNDDNGENSGHVRVYENQSGGWIQIGADIDGEAAGDGSGASVSLSSDGNIMAIGARWNNGNGENPLLVRVNGEDSGHVRVYENQSGVWTQIGQDIDGEAVGDGSGSVSLSSNGNIVAIGAAGNDDNGENSGHVRVYENQSGVWTQIGQDIDGEAVGDGSGGIVSLSSDGNIVAIGAVFNDGNGSDSGHVRVYEITSGIWRQIGQDLDGEAAEDGAFIISLSSDGNIVAIGARWNNGNLNASGHVRVYENLREGWTQIGVDIDGLSWQELSGSSVSLSSDGNILAIGSSWGWGSGYQSGFVKIYINQSGTWTQRGQRIRGEAVNDFSGSSVSLSSDGNMIAISASGNDDNGESSGHVRVYDLSALLSVEESTLLGVKLYPNPTINQFTIELPEGQTLEKVNIYNNLGQLVLSSHQSQINTTELASGSYIVEVITSQGKATKKLILE